MKTNNLVLIWLECHSQIKYSLKNWSHRKVSIFLYQLKNYLYIYVYNLKKINSRDFYYLTKSKTFKVCYTFEDKNTDSRQYYLKNTTCTIELC